MTEVAADRIIIDESKTWTICMLVEGLKAEGADRFFSFSH